MAPKPKLLDRVREAIRARHYSRRSEKASVRGITRYIFFRGKRLRDDLHSRPESRGGSRGEPGGPGVRQP